MSLLLVWSARSAATILLGLLLTLALCRRSAAVRSVALRAILLAVWMLPLAALVAPHLEVSLPQVTVATASPLIPQPMIQKTEESGKPSPSPASAPVAPKPAAHSFDAASPTRLPSSPPPLPWAETAYVAIALGLSLRWLFAMGRLRRIAQSATAIEADLFLTPELSVPATFGLRRPRILLPESSKAWPPARVRAAILHERAHVHRRDWAWQTLAALFAALHWANPFAWLLARALRDVAEAAADDEVLAQMGPSEYARELLAVAGTASSVGPALAMARRGGVRDRVIAILATNRDRRHPTLVTGGLLLLIVLAASLAIAGVRRRTRQTWAKTLASGVRVEIESLQEVGDDPPKTHSEFQIVVNPPKANERRVSLQFRLSGSSGPEPSICLFVPKVNPGAILTSDKPRFQLAWNAPKDKASQTVRLGVASGPWRAYQGSDVPFRARPVRVNGHLATPLSTAVAFPYPSALKGKDVRILLQDANGKTLTLGSEGYVAPTSRAVSCVHWFNRVEPSPVRKLKFEYRDYEIVEFPNVVVRPRSTLALSDESPAGSGLVNVVSTSENAGPFTLPDGRKVQLVEVREPSLKFSRAWNPTGDDPVRSLPPDGLPLSDDPRWRRLRLVVRVKGSNVGDLTSRVAPSSTMRYVSNGGDDRVNADGTREAFERFSVDVPVAAKQSDVKIGFASGPFRKEPFKVSFAPQPLGDDTLTENGRRVPLVRLAVPFPRFLYDRDVRLAAFDVAGKRLEPRRWQTEPGAYNGIRETTNRYDFEAGDARRIARVQFETRPLTWVRFSGVRLETPTIISRKALP